LITTSCNQEYERTSESLLAMKNEGKRISGDSQNMSQKKSSLDGFFAIKRVIIKVKIRGERGVKRWLILR
jgi:hypothetical protein